MIFFDDFLQEDKYNSKKMIRQHFFPKNNIIKAPRRQRFSRKNMSQQSQLSNNFIILDPQITEPLREQSINCKRHHNILKPMYSLVLQSKSNSKPKRQSQEQTFQLESRRKEICSPAKRQFSLAQVTKSRKFSEVENIQFGSQISPLLKTKQTKKKQRIPVSLRLKASPPLDFRSFEIKVKGWQTNIDDFVDFL